MFDENNGFHLVYAKNCGRPKNCFLETRIEVTKFLKNNLNDIDFISINDIIIDKNILINNSLPLCRYLKLKKINEI